MEEVLKRFYEEDRVFHIEAPGTMEGGDVMLVDRHFYVGMSDRTNEEAFRQFAEIVGQFGYEATAVPVTEGLHLKDFVIYLDNGQMLVSAAMNEQPAFAEYERGTIVERTQTGKMIARQNSAFKDGRPRKYSDAQLSHALDLLASGQSFGQVQKMTGISKSTLVRARQRRI